tara:strand:- start:290 stop:403 length:114 start_codon:yes stop_codon:yes gene_type:complete
VQVTERITGGVVHHKTFPTRFSAEGQTAGELFREDET